MMHRLKATIQEALPRYEITDVSSRDNQRRKSPEMREAKYDIPLTTMILERGVTFERISVIVLGADHPVLLNLLWYKSQEEPIVKGLIRTVKYTFSMKKNCSYSKSLSGNQRNE